MTDTGIAILKTLRDAPKPMTTIQLSEAIKFCAKKTRAATRGAQVAGLVRDPYPKARSMQYEITDAGLEVLTELGA